MAALFTQAIYEGFVHEATPQYTDPRLSALLGTAEKFQFQVRTCQASGTQPSLTVAFEESNDGVSFQTRTTLLSTQSLDSTKNEDFFAADTATTPMSRYGRLKVTLGSQQSDGGAHVFVIVTGHSD